MHKIWEFLRRIDKSAIIFAVRRMAALVMPMKPYIQCGAGPRCPCPYCKSW